MTTWRKHLAAFLAGRDGHAFPTDTRGEFAAWFNGIASHAACVRLGVR